MPIHSNKFRNRPRTQIGGQLHQYQPHRPGRHPRCRYLLEAQPSQPNPLPRAAIPFN